MGQLARKVPSQVRCDRGEAHHRLPGGLLFQDGRPRRSVSRPTSKKMNKTVRGSTPESSPAWCDPLGAKPTGVAFRNLFHGSGAGVVFGNLFHAVAETNSGHRAREFPGQVRCARGEARHWLSGARGGLRARRGGLLLQKALPRRCVPRPIAQSCRNHFEATRQKVLQSGAMRSGRSPPLALVTLYTPKGP